MAHQLRIVRRQLLVLQDLEHLHAPQIGELIRCLQIIERAERDARGGRHGPLAELPARASARGPPAR
jgi:hypothetical protein